MDLLAHSPHFDIEEAATIVERLYGLRGAIASLPSERDQNFLVDSSNGDKYVLKIANALEEISLLDAQNDVLSYLSSRVNFCPRIILSIEGRQIESISSRSEPTHLVRLVSFLTGNILGECKHRSIEIVTDLGRKLGQLDQVLLGFDHPALHRIFHWDLANGPRVIGEYLRLVTEPELRRVIEEFAGKFEKEIGPTLPRLRRSLIHGDANDFNILIDGDQVSGIIDFGDMLYSYTVAEVAVALAYLILNKTNTEAVETARLLTQAYSGQNPLNDEEVLACWPLAVMRLCMSVCLAAHQQSQQPDNKYLDISQKAITSSLARLMKLDWNEVAESVRTGPRLPKSYKTLEVRRRVLGANLNLAYDPPLKLVRGNMQYLYDENGREYLDAYNNVAHVGHCHPRVLQAAQEQLARLNTNTRYLHDTINEFAERLIETLPASLSVCYFVNSGSEANELALRLARAHTDARDLIVLDHAYHGNTSTLIDISPYKHNGPGGKGAPSWVHTVPIPDTYRGCYRQETQNAAECYAKSVAAVVDDLSSRQIRLSGFIAESMPSVGGQIVPPAGYLMQVYKTIRAAGGVCIADEVQTGYGRIGSHFWAFDSQQVVPDIVVIGKPIGNGHPLGAVVTTRDIAASFANGMEFFSTFGGNTVSSAIGLEVLKVVLDENLQSHARLTGEQMLRRLRELMPRHELIGDVRGSGFFIGVELVEDRLTLKPATDAACVVVNELCRDGILIGTDGPFHNVLKIRPPMPFNSDDSDRLIDSLDSSLRKLECS